MDLEIKRGPGRPAKIEIAQTTPLLGRRVKFVQLHVAQQLKFGQQPKYSFDEKDCRMHLNQAETLIYVDMGDHYTFFGMGNVLRGTAEK